MLQNKFKILFQIHFLLIFILTIILFSNIESDLFNQEFKTSNTIEKSNKEFEKENLDNIQKFSRSKIKNNNEITYVEDNFNNESKISYKENIIEAD